jgi:hypothetical protein
MHWADHPAIVWLLAGLALLLAGGGTLPYAGSFNDGSRLATTESLIERGTLVIDESIFVHPPTRFAERGILIYLPQYPKLLITGTHDKLLIDGHFYSDKPMVPAILTAGAYRLLMLLGLPRPAERPDVFIWVVTFLTSGLSYAVAVACMWLLGGRVGLSPGWRVLWLLSFAFATVLPAYTRHVNPGLPQVAATAALMLLLANWVTTTGRSRIGPLLAVGLLSGFAYTVEQVSGGLLLVAVTAAVLLRVGRLGPTLAVLLGAMPWLALHHAIHYSIGHVWVPLNMVPEYLEWPGSPFDRTNMTGIARHDAQGLGLYARDLLIGPEGFLLCNLPLLLAVAAGWLVLVRPGPNRIELTLLAAWCFGVWATYSVLSDNGGGACLSIRWFVPLLVPGYWLLARLVAEWRTFRVDFAVLTGWGFILAWHMWTVGPWTIWPIPFFWDVVWAAVWSWGLARVVALCGWLVWRRQRG